MLPFWTSLAGGLGAALRFVVDGLLRTVLGRTFPWGTLIINISGSFVLGILTGLVLHGRLDINTMLVVGTGFCGGFTTFSTASFEAVRLLEERRIRAFMMQIIGNVGLCLLAVTLGLLLIE